jgi:nucleotide-binding universal stress UspA family protein
MVIVATVTRDKPQRRVVEEGQKLAETFGEELHVLNVLKLSEFVDIETNAVRDSGHPESMQNVRNKAESISREAASDVTDDAITVGRIGSPAEQIVQYALDKDASFVVVGGRKRTPTGKAIFGSVTQSVLLEANQPVVTVLQSD